MKEQQEEKKMSAMKSKYHYLKVKKYCCIENLAQEHSDIFVKKKRANIKYFNWNIWIMQVNQA